MTFRPSDPFTVAEQKSSSSTRQTRESARAKRTIGEDPVPAPGHSADHVPADFRQINGWGADLDPANRPSVPRELPSEVMTVRGEVKHWQKPRTKIHVSNEHPGITPVFGESCPPHGLSGLLRDYAYQFGEASNRHWLTLLMADRVDVIESMIADALRGKPDHYVEEKGWAASLRERHASHGSGQTYLLIGAGILGAVTLGILLRRAATDRESL